MSLVPSSFGKILLEKGFATTEQVEHCTRIQLEAEVQGHYLRLGEIFVTEGILTDAKVREVLVMQRKRIFTCGRCSTQFNVVGTARGPEVPCTRCGSPLVEPAQLATTIVAAEIDPERALEVYPGSGRTIGPYRIIGEISRGGMGVVYKAEHLDLHRVIAFKVLNPRLATNPEDGERFVREARAVARLRHQNIVGIHEFGCIEGITYFTMSYLQGVTLDRALLREELGMEGGMRLLVKVAMALDYAHNEGVIHRDVKPSNIIVDNRHDPHLIDFGIAKFRGERLTLDPDGGVWGSLAYMAPEYLTVDNPIYEPTCDVYSLGITMYKMVSGRLPFAAADTGEMVREVLHDEAPRLDDVAPVGPDLNAICHKAIARKPADRYQTARDLGLDLERFLAGNEVSVRPWSLFAKLRRRASKQVAFILLLVVVTFLVATTYRYNVEIRDLEAGKKSLEESGRRHRQEAAHLYLERAEGLVERKKPHAARLAVRRARLLDPDDERAARLARRIDEMLSQIRKTRKTRR